jgi:hypothetical protein
LFVTRLIAFTCDTTITGPGEPSVASSDGCLMQFDWKTIHACPVCTSADYAESKTECTGGKTIVTRLRKTDCNGPEIQAEVTSDCTLSVALSWFWVLVAVVVFLMAVAGIGILVYKNRKLEIQYTQLSSSSKKVQPYRPSGASGDTTSTSLATSGDDEL